MDQALSSGGDGVAQAVTVSVRVGTVAVVRIQEVRRAVCIDITRALHRVVRAVAVSVRVRRVEQAVAVDVAAALFRIADAVAVRVAVTLDRVRDSVAIDIAIPSPVLQPLEYFIGGDLAAIEVVDGFL